MLVSLRRCIDGVSRLLTRIVLTTHPPHGSLLPADLRLAFLFHVARQTILLPTKQTTSVAKIVSEAWRNMNSEERSKWEQMARADKDRFEKEKAAYQGPWTVPIGHRKSKVR